SSDLVTSPNVDEAILDNLEKLFDEAALEYQHIVHREGQTLAAELAAVVADAQESARQAGAQSWLWFLTEDGVVANDALANQLKDVEVSLSVAIAGAKHISDRHLLNVGLTVANNGDVLTMIEPGEMDQAQYDHRTYTFAVALPGMLIKSEVWT